MSCWVFGCYNTDTLVLPPQLQSPYFLKSASFKEMLYQLHDLKKEHVYGRQMYEAAIEPDLCHYYCDPAVLAPIKDMIWWV